MEKECKIIGSNCNNLVEIPFEDEEQYIFIKKENIDSFKYYRYNNKDKDGNWIRSWGFFFVMKDGVNFPVSQKTFLDVISEYIDEIELQKIKNRIEEDD